MLILLAAVALGGALALHRVRFDRHHSPAAMGRGYWKETGDSFPRSYLTQRGCRARTGHQCTYVRPEVLSPARIWHTRAGWQDPVALGVAVAGVGLAGAGLLGRKRQA